MTKTYVSLYHIHSARPSDLNITRHIDCALRFVLLTPRIKSNVGICTDFSSANRVYCVLVLKTQLLQLSKCNIKKVLQRIELKQ